MEKLVCEMCGGTDIIKQDGLFVCQICGLKYTLEEAKKVIEYRIDLSGSTVKLDKSEQLANLYQLAKRAKDENNAENAIKYYEMILLDAPMNWEAVFYTFYFKKFNSNEFRNADLLPALKMNLMNVFNLINQSTPNKEERLVAVKEVTDKILSATEKLTEKSCYDELRFDSEEAYREQNRGRVSLAKDVCYTYGDMVATVFGDDNDVALLSSAAWKKGVNLHESVLKDYPNNEEDKKMFMSYLNKVWRYDKIYAYETKIRYVEQEIKTLENKKNELCKTEIEDYTALKAFGILLTGGGLYFLVEAFINIATNAPMFGKFILGIFMLLGGGIIFWYAFTKPSSKEQTRTIKKEINEIQKQIEINEKEFEELTDILKEE